MSKNFSLKSYRRFDRGTTMTSIYKDDTHAIAHNKIIIIDREAIIMGAFNFTKAAEAKNAEKLLIIKDKSLSKAYLENWYKHRKHSEAYE